MKKKSSLIIMFLIGFIVIFGVTFILVNKNRPHGTLNENLIITNNSSETIYSFGFEETNSLSGGAYADWAPVKKGGSLLFQVDKHVGFEFVLTAQDKSGNEILRSQKFKVNFTEGKVTISIKEDENGKLYAEVVK